MELPVRRIIPFSNVEGIGNRTSIFVQGCNLNCIYCHNSETIPMVSKGVTYFTVDELVNEVKKNMPFIRGITVSGGEATIYPKFLTEFFKEVKKLGITCYIDTNGFFDFEKIKELIDVTDKFLFDIKSDEAGLKKLCFTNSNGSYKSYSVNSNNLIRLIELGKVEEVRLVYLKNYFDDKSLIGDIAKKIANHPEVLFKLIATHVRGIPKARLKLISGNIPNSKDMKKIEDLARANGIENIVVIN